MAIYYADATASGGDGSELNPWGLSDIVQSTIESDSDNERILYLSGTFTARLSLNISGAIGRWIQIRGDGPLGSGIWDMSSVSKTSDTRTAVEATSESFLYIRGITAKHCEDGTNGDGVGILLDDCENCAVLGNNCSQNSWSGIKLRSCRLSLVASNICNDNGIRGIVINNDQAVGNPNPNRSNVVTRNTLNRNGRYGLSIQGSDKITTDTTREDVDCRAFENTGDGNGTGLHLEETGFVRVYNNTFTNNNWSSDYVKLTLTGAVTVTAGETVTQDSGATGVVVDYGSLTDNTIVLSGVVGTFTTTGGDELTGSVSGDLGTNSVPTSIITNATSTGLDAQPSNLGAYIWSTTDCEIYNNTFNGCPTHGLRFTRISSHHNIRNKIYGNYFKGMGESGVWAPGGSLGTPGNQNLEVFGNTFVFDKSYSTNQYAMLGDHSLSGADANKFYSNVVYAAYAVFRAQGSRTSWEITGNTYIDCLRGMLNGGTDSITFSRNTVMCTDLSSITTLVNTFGTNQVTEQNSYILPKGTDYTVDYFGYGSSSANRTFTEWLAETDVVNDGVVEMDIADMQASIAELISSGATTGTGVTGIISNSIISR